MTLLQPLRLTFVRHLPLHRGGEGSAAFNRFYPSTIPFPPCAICGTIRTYRKWEDVFHVLQGRIY